MDIKTVKLSKSFDREKALDTVDLFVKSGTIHGLIGSNGAGKTTLLKVLTGIYKEDEGHVFYNDAPVFENTSVKEKVIFIGDTPFFFSGFSLLQMAKHYKTIYKNWSDTRFKTLYEHFKIDPKKSLNEMSKGMRRQASFILAFSSKPDVLVLDEPFDGLDPIVRRQVKNIILQDMDSYGLTVVLSSHNLLEMENICDAISIMHNGKILYTNNINQMKHTHCKLQIAFKELPDESFYKALNVVQHTVQGRVITCIIEGDIKNIEEKISKFNPLMYDILPITLDEMFAYEMGEIGYAIEDIIIE
ncbi:ABC transporter ATP-binding protein [Nosocomiicoccus ampullae]|uniref:ABC transporter ATP-binding protein n=1 Tax=Nosocomiicoccus ampullae TaxID=489910 RepID=UPI001C5FC533|nr:ABC transporter ATP-binding protein [Nosocomiicoccus ampullae]QYA48694.1 ABC transporter ATP-binding protein [Nosocomiicoccus ampullae]